MIHLPVNLQQAFPGFPLTSFMPSAVGLWWLWQVSHDPKSPKDGVEDERRVRVGLFHASTMAVAPKWKPAGFRPTKEDFRATVGVVTGELMQLVKA